MVHPILDTSASLSSLYSVFFNMLDRMDFRAPLCHLIAMMTSRANAKPLRFNILKQLAQSVPREPALEMLLRIYERLQPNGSSTTAPRGPPIVFPHPDPVWGDHLQAIQQKTGATALSTGLYPRPFIFSSLPENVENRSARPSERPEHHSQNVLELTTVNGIVSHLEDLDIPSLSVRDLNNQLLSRYLSLRPETEVERHLDDALTPLLNGQLDAVVKGEEIKRGVLEDILAHTRFAKVCLPSHVVNVKLTSPDYAAASIGVLARFPPQVGWPQGPAPHHRSPLLLAY